MAAHWSKVSLRRKCWGGKILAGMLKAHSWCSHMLMNHVAPGQVSSSALISSPINR